MEPLYARSCVERRLLLDLLKRYPHSRWSANSVCFWVRQEGCVIREQRVSVKLVGRLTRVSPFFHDAPPPSYRPSPTDSATSQSMTTLSSASPAQRPATAPLKRCRVPVPPTRRSLQPLDDLFGLARMLSRERTPNEDALDRLAHVQPTAPERRVEHHDPPGEHPQ